MTNKGFTINLLKDSQQSDDVNTIQRGNTPYVLWSGYDRIDIKETTSFQEFFEYSFYPNDWIGDIQSLYLYPFIEDYNEPQLCASMQDKGNGLFYYSDIEEPFLFFSLVTVKTSRKNRTNADFEVDKSLINMVLKRLNKLIGNQCIRIKAFRSLGTEDVVFLFLGNKISEIIKSIYLLREIVIKTKNEEFYFCSTTYSVLGQNCIDAKGLRKYQDDEAQAQVLITLQEGKRANKLKELLSDRIENVPISDDTFTEMRIGEYDVQFFASANKDFLNLYLDNNILNATSEIYQKFILNSKTIWFLKDKALPAIDYNDKVIFIDSLVCKNDVNIEYADEINKLKCTVESLQQKIKEERQRGAKTNTNIIAVYQDIILFVKELIKTICSYAHTEWIEYLKRIADSFNIGVGYFLKTLMRDESIVELDKADFEENILELNRVLSDLRNALSHIHKSGEHFYNVPHPAIYYSGSAHKVLLAYYNFIDLVLSLGYLKPHSKNTKQSNINFIITFGITNKVKTSIHFKSTGTLDERLVSFQLPYAALYDFKKYFPAILHEVYHLIAPADRRYRNKLLLEIWLDFYLQQALQFYVETLIDATGNGGESLESIRYNFAKKISQLFLSTQKEVMEVGLAKINGYYISESYTTNGYAVDLDQFDFIQLLNNYFESKECRTLVRKCYNLFDKYLYEKNNEVISEMKSQCKDFNCELEKIIDSIRTKIQSPSHISAYKKALDQNISITVAIKFSAGIKEVICDLFLIKLLGWGLKDYLKYMLLLFEDNKIQWIEHTGQEFLVRIGTIIACFFRESSAECTVEEWLNEKIIDSSFTKQDRNKIVYCFKEYVSLYLQQFHIFLPLLYTESISSIYGQLSKEDKKTFKEKTNKIRKIYTTLSSNSFSAQVQGILSLQVSEHGIPKNNSLSRPPVYDCFRGIIDGTGEWAVSRDLGGYLYQILKIKDQFQNSDEDLWYRGMCDIDYSLLPSIFRSLPKISEKLGHTFIPFGLQAIMLKQAYFQTKTFYDLMENNERPLAARHSFLQHYGIPTNFLDFSTNPLAALYWALNPDDKDDENKTCDAVVYAFSPGKYQRAINIILNEHHLQSKENTNYLYPYHSHSCLSDEYVIQGMTDKEILDKKEHAITYQNEVNDMESAKYRKMPLATVVPQKNDRILAQEGCFVAYNLLSACDPSNPQYPFNYLSLQSIQDEYLRICCVRRIPPQRFLFRIAIPITCKEELNDELAAAFGYSLAKVYPNVDELFAKAKAEVEKYLDY